MRIFSIDNLDELCYILYNNNINYKNIIPRYVAIELISNSNFLIISPCKNFIVILKHINENICEIHFTFHKDSLRESYKVKDTIVPWIFQNTEYKSIIGFIENTKTSLVKLATRLGFKINQDMVTDTTFISFNRS